MFEFVVNRLSVLKHVPFLPQLFDALLKIGTFFSKMEILDYVDDIENEVLSWDNTSIRVHKFGGVQFDLNGKELGHIHGNGLLDVLFNRRIKTELIAQKKVKEHHTFKNSGWVTLQIRTQRHKKIAIELLRYSYETHSLTVA